MRTGKKIFLIVLSLFVLMQFIRPTRNTGLAQTATDVSHAVAVPDSVRHLLQTACYDCHSNHTNYPWYAEVNPVGLWLNHHVNEGKQELNFSEFASYDVKRKKHKLEETAEMLEKLEMPLPSYLWIHKEARLTNVQRTILINWAHQALASLK